MHVGRLGRAARNAVFKILQLAHPIGHAADVDKVHGRDVVAGGALADRAAAQGHGGGKVGGRADAAQCAGGVDEQTADGLFKGELAHHRAVARMDGHGVSHALVLQNGNAALTGALPVLLHIVAQHGAELLAGVGVLAGHLGLQRNEHPRVGGDGHACHLGDVGRGLADDLGVHGAVLAQQEAADLGAFLVVEEVGALPPKLRLDLAADAAFGDDALLRGADGAVVKGLGIHHMLDGQRDVRAALDVGGAVARAYADGGIAGGVRCAHHALAACSQDDAHVAMLHQRTAGLDGRFADAADQALGRTCGLRRGTHQLEGRKDAVLCARMRADDDAVAALEGDQGLVHHRGGGVRGGDDGRDHAHGHADLDDALLGQLPKDTYAALIFDGLPADARAQEVL